MKKRYFIPGAILLIVGGIAYVMFSSMLNDPMIRLFGNPERMAMGANIMYAGALGAIFGIVLMLYGISSKSKNN